MIHDPKEIHIKVALKIQNTDKEKSIRYIHNKLNSEIIFDNKSYGCDYLYEDRNCIYNDIQPLVYSFLSGYNVTIFSYGQSKSGKSSTLGFKNFMKDDVEIGVLQNIIKDVFTNIGNNDQTKIYISFLEVNCNEIYDCFEIEKIQNIEILEIANIIKVAYITEYQINDINDAKRILEKGFSSKTTNKENHLVITITLERGQNLRCNFRLVDLCSSNIKNSHSNDILALKQMFICLSTKANRIPYRLSKITHLLKESFGGNSITLMIACLNSRENDLEESTKTLELADKVRRITNTVFVNKEKSELIHLAFKVNK